MTAAFSSIPLFVWSRHRALILTCAMIYVAIYFASEVRTGAGALLLQPALAFLRLAPFFIPLALFISPASVASLNVARSESAFPRYLFTLPVGTRGLVLPFMAYAALTAGLLWLLAIGLTGGRILLAGPPDAPAEALQRQTWSPFLWSALLAWTQALIWRPFDPGWARVIVLLALIAAHGVLLVAAIHEAVPAGAVIALALLQIPLAYVVAVRGVRRARHAEGTTERRRARSSRSHAAPSGRPHTVPPARLPHRSPLSALVLHDLRLHGRAVTIIITAFVCAPLLIIALVLEGESAMAMGVRLALVAATMLALASLGALFGNFTSNQYRAFPMPAFFASLPLSTGDFAWAKLMASALHVGLITLLIVGIAAGAAAAAGVDPMWHALTASIAELHGRTAAVALVLLAACWLIAWTIGTAMSVVWVGLSGRRQAWHAVNVGLVALLFALALGARWSSGRPDVVPRLLESVPNLLVIAAAAKLALLAGLACLAGTRSLYSWRRLLAICVVWCFAVAGGAMLVVQFLPSGSVSALTVLWSLIVVTPALGIVAAPLALAWNRNR